MVNFDLEDIDSYSLDELITIANIIVDYYFDDPIKVKALKRILLRIKKETLKLKNLNEELYDSNLLDELTKLYNRKVLADLNNNIGDATIIMIDIDNFKSINDTFGHSFGDKILKNTANIIKNCCRTSDYPIRFGGDEFLIILNKCPIARGFEIASNIKSQIEKKSIKKNYEDVSVTVSVGLIYKNKTETLENAINKADEALYESKNSGKNYLTVYKK